jgi:hypothetical protein
MSVCLGAFALAEARLLDGRRATTHWRFADRLKERYPKIDVDPSVLYVVDGQILTSEVHEPAEALRDPRVVGVCVVGLGGGSPNMGAASRVSGVASRQVVETGGVSLGQVQERAAILIFTFT